MPDKVVVRLITRKPADAGDISAPKQTYVYHWHRIVAALVIILAAISGIIGGVRHFSSSPAPTAQTAVETAAAPAVNATPIPQNTLVKQEPKAAAPLEPDAKKAAEVIGERQPGGENISQASVSSPFKVAIRSPSIKRAQLTSNVVDGQPVDQIGPIIALNGKSSVKVFLWTELDDIKGRKMFHDWYWQGKRVFHARIPVTRSHQSGTSIKFIDRGMTGAWEVKVVDNYDRVYAEARFEVR